MFDVFYPDFYMTSTYEIDFEKLYMEGYRGIIFDIDNTLVPHGEPADDKSIALFKQLNRIGFDVVLLSNNKEPRVKGFAEAVFAKYIFKANKPSAGNYHKAMERMGCNVKNTLFVGDQLFTDVWGAKRLGIRNFWVQPIHPKEEIQIVIKRYLEKVVYHFYQKECKRKGLDVVNRSYAKSTGKRG